MSSEGAGTPTTAERTRIMSSEGVGTPTTAERTRIGIGNWHECQITRKYPFPFHALQSNVIVIDASFDTYTYSMDSH